MKSEDKFNGLSMYSTFLIYESDGLSLCMCVIEVDMFVGVEKYVAYI